MMMMMMMVMMETCELFIVDTTVAQPNKEHV
jgi:hypothetical protein